MPPLRSIIDSAGGDDRWARQRFRHYLAPWAKHGVLSFLPRRREATRCARAAYRVALAICAQPGTLEKLLDWEERDLREYADINGREAAMHLCFRQASGGEEWADSHVFEKFLKPKVKEGVRRILGDDPKDPSYEDAVSEALRYLRARGVLIEWADWPESKIAANAVLCGRHRALDLIRMRKHQTVSLDAQEELASQGEAKSIEPVAQDLTPEEYLLMKERRAALRCCVAALRRNRRQVVEARLDHDDLADEELAATLGLKYDNFRQLWHRALEDLEICMRRHART